jgi:hypothetical protein
MAGSPIDPLTARRIVDTLARVGWYRLALFALLATVNALLVVSQIGAPFAPDRGYDYRILLHASQLADPFVIPQYLWSPYAAWILGPLLSLGFVPWCVLHVAALALLRRPLLIAVVGLSWPFWFDLTVGNVMIFVAIAGYYALRGNRVAMVVVLVIAALAPRPLMFPIVAWLLWRQPAARIWLAGILIAHLGLLIGNGFLVEWVQHVGSRANVEVYNSLNVGPSRFLGPTLGVLLAVPLACLLTLRGRLGWASVAASYYAFPMYWLMLLLEAVPHDRAAGPRRGTSTHTAEDLRRSAVVAEVQRS